MNGTEATRAGVFARPILHAGGRFWRVMLVHRVARNRSLDRIDGLAAAMLLAAVAITPVGVLPAARALALPATAVVVGAIVLAQVPSARELVGVAFIVFAVGLHSEANVPDAGAAGSSSLAEPAAADTSTRP